MLVAVSASIAQDVCRQRIVRAQQHPRPGSEPDGEAALPKVPTDYVWADSELQEQFEGLFEFEQTLSTYAAILQGPQHVVGKQLVSFLLSMLRFIPWVSL